VTSYTKGPRALENLAQVARCDSTLATHLWAIRQRALHACCSEGRHAVAGAWWAEEPLGGLKSWPTSHDAKPRYPKICGRHGSVSCTLTAVKSAIPLPALGLKNPWAARKAGPRFTKRHCIRQTPLDGTTARLARLLRVFHAYCGKGRHAAAGAWAEGPLGGLKS
jgi:hypothetical protein